MATAKKLPSGNFRVRVLAGKDLQGKKKYKSFTAKTKKEAELMAAEYLNGIRNEVDTDITLGVAIDNYIEERSNILSPSSIKKYNSLSNKLEDYKDVKLSKINTSFVQSYINDLALESSPKYVSDTYGFINAVLKRYNPSVDLHVKLPSKKRYDRYIPSQEEINTLYGAVKGSIMELPILLGSMAMLRRSEICALTKDDFKGNTIHIHKAMVRTPDNKWFVKSPKTYTGDRYVEVLPYITELFMALPEDSIGLNPDNITDRFTHLRESLKLPYFRFHDLRASGASIRHALGVPDLYVMSAAGWSNDRMLKEIYGTTMTDFGNEYNNKIANYYNNILSTKDNYSILINAVSSIKPFLDDTNFINWLGDREKSIDLLCEFALEIEQNFKKDDTKDDTKKKNP